MYFDDFKVRRLLQALWRGVRQVAWGIDAASSIRHGIALPPDHGARRRPVSDDVDPAATSARP